MSRPSRPTSRRAAAAATLAAVALLAAGVRAGDAHVAPQRPRVAAPTAPADTPRVVAGSDSAAGAYLATITGCNDCHTAGWQAAQGKIPDADRMAGSNLGFKGPWGTTYAANLRTIAARQTEDRWVEILTTNDGGHGRAPMPYANTAVMSQADLRAMYRYLKALGPKGSRAPRGIDPGVEPQTPYLDLTPREPAVAPKPGVRP